MVDVASRVTAVTVFMDRARVSRRGRVTLEPGLQRVELTELPLSLDPASLRTAARGVARATIRGVELRRSFFAAAPAARVQELEAAIEALENEDRELQDRLETLARRLAHLDGLSEATSVYAAGLARGRMTVEAQRALLDSLDESRSLTQRERRDVDAARRRIGRELHKLRQELDQLRGARPRERYTAVLELSVATAGDLDVDISYVTSGASWTPMYDIRLGSEGLDLAYLAEVSQRTGEDWVGVDLTLSTAQPALAAVLPELQPWFVMPEPPAAPMMFAAAMPAPGGADAVTTRKLRAAAEPAMAAEAAPPPPVVEADTARAEVGQSGPSATFHIEGDVDIPGDGSGRKTTIAFSRLPHQMEYVTTPRLAEAVYRRVKAQNASAYLLLPGRAQLFEGEDFIGATALNLTPPGRPLDLYFGTDDRFKVERELARQDVDRRFLGDKRRVTLGYTISVENHTGAPQVIEVRDQIPVGRHEDIRVKLEESKPNPTSQDDVGRLAWRLPLPPATPQRLRYEFTVEFPRAMNVIGLPA